MATPPFSPVIFDVYESNIKERCQSITLMEAYKNKSLEEIRLADYVKGTFGTKSYGTALIPFKPIQEIEIEKISVSDKKITMVLHQNITSAKEYKNKSVEELRLEDYNAGRKGKRPNPHLIELPNQNFFNKNEVLPNKFVPQRMEENTISQVITVMMKFRNISFEELRLADYKSGRGRTYYQRREILLPDPPETLHMQMLNQIEDGTVPPTLMEWYKTVVKHVREGGESVAKYVCIKTMEETASRETTEYAFYATILGIILKEIDQLEKAIYLFEKALEIRTRNFGEQNAMVVRSLIDLTSAHARNGDALKADLANKRAIQLLHQMNDQSVLMARVYMDKAILLKKQGYDFASSQDYLTALDYFVKNTSVNNSWVAVIRDRLLDYYHSKGNYSRLEFLITKLNKYKQDEEKKALVSEVGVGVERDVGHIAEQALRLRLDENSNRTESECAMKFSAHSSVALDVTESCARAAPPAAALCARARIEPYQRVAIQASCEIKNVSLGFSLNEPNARFSSDSTLLEPENGYFVKQVPSTTLLGRSLFFYYKPTGELFYGVGSIEKGCLMTGLPSSGMYAVLVFRDLTSTVLIKLTSYVSSAATSENNFLDFTKFKFPPENVSTNQTSQTASQSAAPAATNHESRFRNLFQSNRSGGSMISANQPRTNATRNAVPLSIEDEYKSRTVSEFRSTPWSQLSPLQIHRKRAPHVAVSGPVVTVGAGRSTYVFSLLPAMFEQVFRIQALSYKGDKPKELAIGFTTTDPDRLDLFELPVMAADLLLRDDIWEFDMFDVTDSKVVALKLKPSGEVLVQCGLLARRPLRVDPSQTVWMFIHSAGAVESFKVQHLCPALPDPPAASLSSRVTNTTTAPSEMGNITTPFRFTPLQPLSQLPLLAPIPSLTSPPFTFGSPITSRQNASSQFNDRFINNRTETPVSRNNTSVSTGAAVSQSRIGASVNQQKKKTDSAVNPQSASSVDDQDSRGECKICLDNEINATLLDCGHCMCFDCATAVKNDKQLCPICRRRIREVFRLFMS